MMSQSFFIFKNIDCRSMGVHLTSPVSIIRPEERVNHVTIQGRSGELTLLEGEDVFNSYIQTVSISVTGAQRMSEVLSWLKGEGYVTFHGEPEKRQKARVIGAVTLDRLSRNLDIWQGDVQFYCEPYKSMLSEPPVTFGSSGGTINNIGDISCKPIITVTVNTGVSFSVTVNGKTISVDMSGRYDTKVVIDCDAQEVTNASGSEKLTVLATGEFPMLNVGANSISGSGFTGLSVERRCRYL